MSITIKNIEDSDIDSAVKIFASAFLDDPLHMLAFPEKVLREKSTTAIYDFVIKLMIPKLGMIIKGLYEDNELSACTVYSVPESLLVWTEDLVSAAKKNVEVFGEYGLSIISEYSALTSYQKPDQPHVYLNEVAVAPQKQNRGYGRKLFEYVESVSDGHPESIGVALNTSNAWNADFYERLGYILVRKIPFYGISAHTMFKLKKAQQ